MVNYYKLLLKSITQILRATSHSLSILYGLSINIVYLGPQELKICLQFINKDIFFSLGFRLFF